MPRRARSGSPRTQVTYSRRRARAARSSILVSVGAACGAAAATTRALNRVFVSSDETTNRIELKLAPEEKFDYALPDRSEFLDAEG